MELSANLQPLAGIVGTWKGEGRGTYPTITPFQYTEEITFTNIGKPFLHYMQRTWNAAGLPLHTETGYLRSPGNGVVEMTLALPTGQTELLEGTLREEDGALVLTMSGKVLNTATAKRVEATERTYRLSGDRLASTMRMAAVGVDMNLHLTTEFSRV